jgi:hypothetical protein
MAMKQTLSIGAALAILALSGALPAQACNCPKEYMIKKYGTVSQIRPFVPPAKPAPPLPAPEAGQGG